MFLSVLRNAVVVDSESEWWKIWKDCSAEYFKQFTSQCMVIIVSVQCIGQNDFKYVMFSHFTLTSGNFKIILCGKWICSKIGTPKK